MKTCSTCSEPKTFDHYHKNGKGGLRGTCKACVNATYRNHHSTVYNKSPLYLDLPEETRTQNYRDVIGRMRILGIMSAATAREALERVG